MPAYDIEHIVRLSDSQKDQLAEAITKIHSETFSTPKFFVNIIFKDVTGLRVYVGGKHVCEVAEAGVRPNNRITATVRHGESRTQAMYEELCFNIVEAWNAIVGGSGNAELRAVSIYGSKIAGYEAGIMRPPAGSDAEWIKDNYPKFKKRAEEGDEDCQAIVEDLKGRFETS